MCGIAGAVSKTANVLFEARTVLNRMNNRGESGCGGAFYSPSVSSPARGRMEYYHGEGRVAMVFGDRDRERWSKFSDATACAMQTTYSTIGRGGEGKQPLTDQPVHGNFRGRRFAVAHNGNLVRLDGLRKQAKRAGYKFKSEVSDTEVIAALLSTSRKKDFLEALMEVLKKIEGKGAFSLVILFGGKLYGVRDQNGIRPLCIIKKSGKNGEDDTYILASESCVYPSLEAARFMRDVDVGELVVIGGGGIERSIKWTGNTKSALCVCELIYFANPASRFFGKSAYSFRVKAGEKAAKNHPVDADVAVPVPESGCDYGDGFASASGIPFRRGLVKSRYSLDNNRTFIEARDVDRKSKQRTLQAIPDVMEGQRVVAIEDSVFRASVGPAVVKMSREHGGARQFHLRICSPPACHRCHLGLDTSTLKELVAANMTVEEIRDKVMHCDSLEYLTVDELREVIVEIGLNPDDFCMGCFTGKYPVDPPEDK